jgi:hypothetical protein
MVLTQPGGRRIAVHPDCIAVVEWRAPAGAELLIVGGIRYPVMEPFDDVLAAWTKELARDESHDGGHTGEAAGNGAGRRTSQLGGAARR